MGGCDQLQGRGVSFGSGGKLASFVDKTRVASALTLAFSLVWRGSPLSRCCLKRPHTFRQRRAHTSAATRGTAGANGLIPEIKTAELPASWAFGFAKNEAPPSGRTGGAPGRVGSSRPMRKTPAGLRQFLTRSHLSEVSSATMGKACKVGQWCHTMTGACTQ